MELSSTEIVIRGILPQLTDQKAWISTEWMIPADSALLVMTALRNNPTTQYNMLVCELGVDIDSKLGIVYHLRSTVYQLDCFLRVVFEERNNPTIDSVTELWAGAEFMEREIFDLYGIQFTNHPNLKRLFLEDDFVGFPLRKDFADSINMIQL